MADDLKNDVIYATWVTAQYCNNEACTVEFVLLLSGKCYLLIVGALVCDDVLHYIDVVDPVIKHLGYTATENYKSASKLTIEG